MSATPFEGVIKRHNICLEKHLTPSYVTFVKRPNWVVQLMTRFTLIFAVVSVHVHHTHVQDTHLGNGRCGSV